MLLTTSPCIDIELNFIRGPYIDSEDGCRHLGLLLLTVFLYESLNLYASVSQVPNSWILVIFESPEVSYMRPDLHVNGRKYDFFWKTKNWGTLEDALRCQWTNGPDITQ